MNVGRAFLAAGLQLVIAGVITTNVVPFSANLFEIPAQVPTGETIRTTVLPTSRILIGVIAAFIAGWWGASGLGKQWIGQGLLTGAVVAVFGVALATASGGMSPRTSAVLLDAAAAVAGAGLASMHVRIRRAFVAAGVQVVATVAITFVLLMVFSVTAVQGEVSESDAALVETYLPWTRLLVALGTAFLAGWWGAREVDREAAVAQGLLIGGLTVIFTGLFIIVLSRRLDPLVVLFTSPYIAAAIAGSLFARTRNRAQPS